MIRKVIIVFFLLPIGCMSPIPDDDKIHVPESAMLTSADLTADDVSMVVGMVFEVDSFSDWMDTYSGASSDLIIALRNVDHPDLTLVFEGAKSMEQANERVNVLSSEDFLSESTALGSPISSFYDIKYYVKADDPPDHFLALSFAEGGDPEQDWLEFVKTNKEYFSELKIDPAGIGIDPERSDRAYILLRQYDFVATRKMLNSPRKIHKFLERLQLPEHTLISYWIRISQTAN